MQDDAFITSAMVVLFVIGLLWSGWIGSIRTWIAGKVNEPKAS